MPAVNRQEPDIHPAVSSRAVHLPDGNDFGTGTFTTALAPNALKCELDIGMVPFKRLVESVEN